MIRVIGVLKNQEAFDAVVAKQEGREPSHYHGTFASHPDNDTRLQQVVGEAGNLKVANPSENKSEFLKQTEGLVFNDSVSEGVVRNNKFMHPDLGIALTFPPEWHVKNSTAQLVALSPQSDATIQLKIDYTPSGTVTEYAHRAAGNGAAVETLEIEKLHAAIGSANNAVLGIIYFDRKAFLIQCNAKTAEAYNAQREAMKTAIRSFHALSEDERMQIKPLAIKLITAKKGDTYAKLAQHSPLGKNAESYLRLINEQYPQGEPAVGQSLKTIE
jgi:predicted Zn-dependent protease